jgi:hypothetical protein
MCSVAGIESWHWRVFNIGVRLFGLMALIVALGFILSAMLVPGLFVFLLACPFFIVRPYRPDLGDRSWIVDPFGSRANSRVARRWWTGDEK